MFKETQFKCKCNKSNQFVFGEGPTDGGAHFP